MKNVFFKSILIALSFILPISLAHANQGSAQKSEKTYTLKITSLKQGSATPLNGMFMEWKKDSIYSIDLSKEVTPYETTFNAIDVGMLISTTSLASTDKIRLELVEKNGNKETTILSGEGRSFMSFEDASGVERFIIVN